MDKQNLQNLVTWAQNNAWVMKVGEYNPADMHALPKGKLIEIFDALEYLVGQYGTAQAIAAIEPMKELNQRDRIKYFLVHHPKSTLSEIASAIGNKSVANVQKTINSMIKEGIVNKYDDGTFTVTLLLSEV
jgi:hypothetical protein